MKHKTIKLVIIVTALTLVTTACSISVTRNYYSEKPKTPLKTDSTSYVLKLDSETYNPNDGER